MDDGRVPDGRRWTMDECLTADDGRWTMDDGRWTMDDGRWTTGDGGWAGQIGLNVATRGSSCSRVAANPACSPSSLASNSTGEGGGAAPSLSGFISGEISAVVSC